jgi:hypothetical protein
MGSNACGLFFLKDFVAVDRVFECNLDTFATDFDAGKALQRLRRWSQHYPKNSDAAALWRARQQRTQQSNHRLWST